MDQKNNQADEIKCEILQLNDANLEICGKRIRDGKLVAFPTETVYGLGANALDLQSCLNIFKTKGRPLSDPIIVHIADKDEIYNLVEMTEQQKLIFECLAKKFWPGPLTMIFKAKQIVPKALTANTGFVGIRLPNHPTALQFIKISKRPIAAPSANLFNHVSPTTAHHVFNDFHNQDVTIIDDGKTTLGIESTVLKIEDNLLTFFRLGSLPKDQIDLYLNKQGFNVKIVVSKKIHKESQKCISPGQFIKHYSPKMPAYILTSNKDINNKKKLQKEDLKSCVLIDFSKINQEMEKDVLGYFDLSKKGSLKEAIRDGKF